MELTKDDMILRFAISEYIADWPHNRTNEEIIEMLTDKDEAIVVWEPFEKYPVEIILEWIYNLNRSLSSFIKEWT